MARDKNPLDQLARIFAALGPTPDDVADALRAEGCRGLRGAFPDPITRYAYRLFDDGWFVFYLRPPTMRHHVYLYRLDGSREEMPLPPPIGEFLDLFKQGAYPDLELDPGGSQNT